MNLQDLVVEKNDIRNIEMVIIISEHKSFVDKLQRDLKIIEPSLVIYYSGRKLNYSYLKLIKDSFFKKSIIISEYFNFVPRLLSIITRSKSISIIYGVIASSKVIAPRFKIDILNRLIHPLYASEFYIINRAGTFNLLKRSFNTVPIYLATNQLKSKNISGGHYTIWVSQCWGEDGHHEIEKFQKKCVTILSNIGELVIVLHPRDSKSKYAFLNNPRIVDGITESFKYFDQVGIPNRVIGIASSALLEFQDFGLNVMRVENNYSQNFTNNVKDLKSIPLLPITGLNQKL